MDRGADVNAVDYAGFSCLSLAARRGRVLIARSLVRRGAEVDLPGRSGRCAAHEVCMRANKRFAPRFLRILLASGADVHGADDEGRTPLMHRRVLEAPRKSLHRNCRIRAH
jgi:ankyrin repeat protein